jgi:hypothetical protein
MKERVAQLAAIVTFAVVFIVKCPAFAAEPDHQRVDRGFAAEESKVTHEIDVVGAPDVVLEEILRGTGIPGGVVRIEGCSEGPTLHVGAAEGTTVVDTMESLAASNPAYSWELRNGVVNLLPVDQSAEILDVQLISPK